MSHIAGAELGRMQGSCVGYGIASDLPFVTVRDGGGTPLYVDERRGLGQLGTLVLEWLPRPGNPFHGRLYQEDGVYAFWSSDAGWFRIDPEEPSVSVSPTSDPFRRELRLFGVPVALCAFAAGDITIHASAIEVDGQAILFAGPTRYGKTTLAAAFARAGHRLLTEDSTRCRVSSVPAVYPGPAALRLRTDVATSITIPGTTIGGTYDDRIALVVDREQRGQGTPVPLRMIVVPRLGPDAPSLAPISVPDAVRDLMALTFRPPFAESRATAFARVAEVASRVEMLDLTRQMTMESLDDIVALVERRLSGS